MAGRWVLAALVACIAGSAFALGGGGDKKDDALAPIEARIEKGDYEEALAELTEFVQAEPTSADAFNWLGYANRKLGRLKEAEGAYARALQLDPDHKGAHEYAGELRLMLDDLEGAERHLGELDRICLLGCEEYDELKAAITAWKQARGG